MNKFVDLEDELSDVPTKTLKPQTSAPPATRAGTGAVVIRTGLGRRRGIRHPKIHEV